MASGEFAVIRALLIDSQIPRPIEDVLTIARELPWHYSELLQREESVWSQLSAPTTFMETIILLLA
jgi:hypothetical protein